MENCSTRRTLVRGDVIFSQPIRRLLSLAGMPAKRFTGPSLPDVQQVSEAIWSVAGITSKYCGGFLEEEI
jgi:hypothetical protein